MKIYNVTVIDDFDNRSYIGEFQADNETDAIQEALDFYAYELDTTKESLQVRGVEIKS